MRGLVVVGALLLVACGPTKAEMAFQACQTQMAAKNWEAAESACKIAVDLRPANTLYASAYATATVEAFTIRTERNLSAHEAQQRASDAALAMDTAEMEAIAATRQADALEQLASRRDHRP